MPCASPLRSVFVDEAASLLGVSRRTIYYRIREGRLRTIRTACGTQRVLRESIEALQREDAAKRAARLSLREKDEDEANGDPLDVAESDRESKGGNEPHRCDDHCSVTGERPGSSLGLMAHPEGPLD